MKKIFWLFALCTTLLSALQAAPVLRQLITLTQPDGSTLQAWPMGDEYRSYLTDAATGECLTKDKTTGYWRPMTDEEVSLLAVTPITRQPLYSAQGTTLLGGGTTPTKGTILVPFILVQFQDVTLTEEWGSTTYWEKNLNQLDYDRVAYTAKTSLTDATAKDYHTGSVRNYFQAQSLGQFDPTFDVLGTITLSHTRSYYGSNEGTAHDSRKNEFFQEIISQASDLGWLDNGAKYDANKDGIMDMLYIIFAGQSENENPENPDLIWSSTSWYNYGKTKDNVRIVVTCCTAELNRKEGLPDGIGVFAHEFSHALGLPDLYSTNTNAASKALCYGMDAWSLMDQGNYNGKGQIPTSFTAHERMLLGWIGEPDTLPTVGKDTLPPFCSTGVARILRNPNNPNEFLTFENHQPENIWEIPWGGNVSYAHSRGLLITHVDFDEGTWDSNHPNWDPKHQRCTPLSADGDNMLFENSLTWLYNQMSDCYPGYSNITTLNESNPLAVWWTGDSIGNKIKIDITNIVQLADGSIELTLGNPEPEPAPNAIQELDNNAQRPADQRVRYEHGRFTVQGHDLFGRRL